MVTVQLRAGAATSAMRLSLPVEGFADVHDPLHVRALVLSAGPRTVVVVVIDFTSLPAGAVGTLKEMAATAAGTVADDVLICVTHTFSAPHLTVPPEDAPAGELEAAAALDREVHRAVADAVSSAAERSRPATVGAADGVSRTAASRDVLTPYGWWLGVNEYGTTDRTVRVVRLDDRETGRPIAVLFTHSTPPAVMIDSRSRSGGRVVTADLAGAACAVVEGSWPGCVAFALLGSAGDQTPVYSAARPQLDEEGRPHRADVHDAGFALVELLGNELGAAVATAADSIATGPATVLGVERFTVELPAQRPVPFLELRPRSDLTFVQDGVRDAPVVVLRLGDVVLVGVQPELAAVTGSGIIDGSPFRHTHVATMVDGASKYLMDSSGYERRTYGAMNSMFAAGAAEILAERVGVALRELGGATASDTREHEAAQSA